MTIEDVFDLNELNVKKFTKYCMARPDDKAEDVIKAYTFLDEEGNPNPNTILPLSRKRLDKQKDRIWSMLGQLKAVHDQKPVLTTADFQIKYDGTRWTDDPNLTLFLFALGNAGMYYGGLKKWPDGIYRVQLEKSARKMWPWESPGDPKLKEWFDLPHRPEDYRDLFGGLDKKSAYSMSSNLYGTSSLFK